MENLRGIGLMILAMAAFTTGDMFLKLTTSTIDVPQIMVTEAVIGSALFSLIVYLQGDRVFGRDMMHWAVIWRNISEVAGLVGMFMALALIDFSAVSAITQATPLVVTLGAALFLREQVGWRRWSAIFIGLAGVLIIIRPGLTGFDYNALWAVLAVVGIGMRDLLSRPIPTTISTARLSTLAFLIMIPTGLAMAPFYPAPILPDAVTWAYLILMILLTMVAYFAITTAMRLGEVSAIAPFRYSRLLFALGIGIVIFGERPDSWTIAGALLTVAAGLYSFLREAKVRRP